MGLASVAIGMTSGMYHASMTFFWQFFDVSSMFMLILLALSFNLIRADLIEKKHFTVFYLGTLSLSMGAMLIFQGQSGELIFAIEAVCLILSEIKIRRHRESTDNSYFIRAISIFLLSFLIWIGDIKGWWCWPSNHILQGHALWHILNALVIWYLYRFYKTFEEKLI